jgi:hypothetical protein
VIGTPNQVRSRIEEIAARTDADEIMITSHAFDQAARIRSYELISEEFRLSERPAKYA